MNIEAAYDSELIHELNVSRPDIPVGLLSRNFKQKLIEESISRLYRWYVDRSQRTRNWSPDRDIDWKSTRQDHSEELDTILRGFFAVEQYVPDYASKLTNLTRESYGRSHFQLRWGAEEEKHATLWMNACIASGKHTWKKMMEYAEQLRGREWHLPWEDPMHMTFYTIFQERATQINYLNTAVIVSGQSDKPEFANDADPVLLKACKVIAVDEAAHYNFFLEAGRLFLYYFPAEALEAINNVLSHFAMPAGSIIPDYSKFSETVWRAGVYGPREYAKDVIQVALNNLGIQNKKAVEKGVLDSRLVPDEDGNLRQSALFEAIDFGEVRNAVARMVNRYQAFEREIHIADFFPTPFKSNYQSS